MKEILRIEGITQAEIRGEKFFIFNTCNTIKEVGLNSFIIYLVSLEDKVLNISFKNGEIKIYLKMLQQVECLRSEQNKFILDGILKIIEESV
ncbi:MAG: hypothetical protein LIR50_05545 [Bacillota bacterium]|nr:hypothetical protein [Bacillota bacterium]